MFGKKEGENLGELAEIVIPELDILFTKRITNEYISKDYRNN
jgi:hypothetical protein